MASAWERAHLSLHNHDLQGSLPLVEQVPSLERTSTELMLQGEKVGPQMCCCRYVGGVPSEGGGDNGTIDSQVEWGSWGDAS